MTSVSTYTSDASSGIHNLAPELLSEIFLLCLPDPQFWSMRSASQAPLSLGRVCSRWRTISHSSAALWSNFNIKDFAYEMQESAYAKDTEALQVWIEKSRSHQVSVTIILDSEFQRTAVSNESFETSAGSHKSILALETRRCIDAFGLREHIGRSIVYEEHRQIGAFEAVLELSLGRGDLLTRLMQCPHLTTLLYRLRHISRIPEYPAVLELRHLCSLTLLIDDPHLDLSTLFDHIHIPKLTKLELVMFRRCEPHWPHLLAMLKRCNPPLASLSLRWIRMRDQTLLECLSYTPELRILDTFGIQLTDVTLMALTAGGDAPNTSAILCPRLQQLNLGTACRFSEDAMKYMILSRWSGQRLGSSVPTLPGTELNQVRYPSSSGDILSDTAISKFVEEGLQLRISLCDRHK
ncbi:hypothetical protein BD410DRAFT_805478 [Rickenella mellea]|uniref:F-box domain-containing protein n=1 Tax=Rickenella mellea TaxID=50990 RepID=A0A4Y7PXL4_9AGAM|nr:hypothetical protein BD410DRAFT_805478 [Rickenella mellea]